MVRQAKVVYDKDGKAVTKDYLTYVFDVQGKDWLGNEMRVSSNIEGKYLKPKFSTKTSFNYETGEPIESREHNGTEEVYTIELTEKNRKKVIEDIINKSTGSTIDGIKWVAKFGDTVLGPSFRCNTYTYDQFINSSLDQLERLARKQGGPQGNAVKYNNPKPYMG